MNINLSRFDVQELESCARRFNTSVDDLVDSCLYFLPAVIAEDFGYQMQVEYRTKYKTLLNALFAVARKSTINGDLYAVDDEDIYKVLKALEPELYEAKQRALI